MLLKFRLQFPPHPFSFIDHQESKSGLWIPIIRDRAAVTLCRKECVGYTGYSVRNFLMSLGSTLMSIHGNSRPSIMGALALPTQLYFAFLQEKRPIAFNCSGFRTVSQEVWIKTKYIKIHSYCKSQYLSIHINTIYTMLYNIIHNMLLCIPHFIFFNVCI